MKNPDNRTDQRSPEEIESDIARTRADFSSTIDAIQHKLSPSEMMDNAVDYAMSTTPGVFSMNLVNSVRDNPIPVSLIGIGIAWLIMADRSPKQAYPRTVRRRAYSEADIAYDPYEAYEGMDEQDYLSSRSYVAGQDTGESGEGMMQRVKSRTSEKARDIKDTANQVGQRISDTASSVTGRVQQASQTARYRLQESASSAQARLNELSRRSQEQYAVARDRFGHMIDEQPLVVGALGVALGAALGAAMPRTRREDEMMGSTRDNLLERARETARGQAETLKQSAQRIAETAKQEAERVKDDMSNTAMHRPDQGTTHSSTGTGSAQFGGTTGSSSIH